jgi:hypothetical protein
MSSYEYYETLSNMGNYIRVRERERERERKRERERESYELCVRVGARACDVIQCVCVFQYK